MKSQQTISASHHYADHPEKSWMTYFVDRKYQVHSPPIVP
jgi:hypothetical protein